METRRKFLKGLILLPLTTLLSGWKIMPTLNIELQKHNFELLQSSGLKKKEMGSRVLTISNASFSNGEVFRDVGWDNFVFENCEFKSDTQLYRLNNIVFRNCVFDTEYFQAYDWIDVQLINCEIRNGTHIYSGVSSKNVVFDNCTFKSDAENWNDYGAVVIHDVIYKNCQAENFSVDAFQKGVYQNCKFKNTECDGGQRQSGEIKGYAAEYLIEDCEFSGFINYRSGIYSSFTMRRTNFDLTSFAQAEIQGQFLMENVKGGFLDTQFKKVKSIVVRNCEFIGRETLGKKRSFAIEGGGDYLDDVTIENVKAALDEYADKWGKGCSIGGGNKTLTMKNVEMPVCCISPYGTQITMIDGLKSDNPSFSYAENVGTMTVKNLTAVDAKFTNMKAKEIDLEEVQCQTAEFNESEIGTLRFVKNVYVGKKIDFTKAKLGAVDFGGIAVENGNRFGAGATKAVTTGSNLEVVKGQLQLKK